MTVESRGRSALTPSNALSANLESGSGKSDGRGRNLRSGVGIDRSLTASRDGIESGVIRRGGRRALLALLHDRPPFVRRQERLSRLVLMRARTRGAVGWRRSSAATVRGATSAG